MRILLLLPQLPFPLDQGAKLRNYALIRVLAREHALSLLCFTDHPPSASDVSHLRQFCESLDFLPAPAHAPLSRLRWLTTSTLPDLAFRRWSPAFAQRARHEVRTGRYDAVHVSNIEMAAYLSLAEQQRRVFDDHNAEFLLQARAQAADAKGVKSSLLRAYSREQARRLRRFEARACLAADLVLAVSAADREQLRRLDGRIEPQVVPNAIDPDMYPTLPPSEAARPFLMFSGKLDYRPNEDALRWFLGDILPLVWRSRPEVRFLAVGHAPPPWLVAAGQRDRRIVVTGPVDDDRPYLARSAVYVLPMRWGGGVRFKALIAMASGRPLVSTSMGMEGIEFTPDDHAMIADTPREFSSRVVQVLDARASDALVGRARQLVEQCYSLEAIAPRLLEAYRALALPRRRGLG